MTLYFFDFLILIASYLLGSIPFGLLLVSKAGLGDVRNIGSGNIGATNVLRAGRKDIALYTLVLDGFKGALAVLIAKFLVLSGFGHFFVIPIAGAFAVLGHVFPVWLRFKGGKGVITAIVVFIALDWSFGLFISVIWLSVFFLAHISSLSAIVSMIVAIIASSIIYQETPFNFVVVAIALLVLLRHRENIIRLVKGEEPRSKVK